MNITCIMDYEHQTGKSGMLVTLDDNTKFKQLNVDNAKSYNHGVILSMVSTLEALEKEGVRNCNITLKHQLEFILYMFSTKTSKSFPTEASKIFNLIEQLKTRGNSIKYSKITTKENQVKKMFKTIPTTVKRSQLSEIQL